jgi:hypothetical protein
VGSVAALAFASAARANLLVNGGLEPGQGVTPTMPDNLIYMKPTLNATALPGWQITSGAVDLVPNTYMQNTQGSYAVDLVGTPGIGVLKQTIATTIGRHYQLTFDYSINPENLTLEAGSSKKLSITATGTGTLATQTYTYPFAMPTKTNMHYVQGATFIFTANSLSTTISLTAILSGLPSGVTSATAYCGPVIDNLDLVATSNEPPSGEPVPEPASLMTLGLGGALLLRRRKKA